MIRSGYGPVRLFGTADDADTNRLRARLDALGLPYEFHDTERDPDALTQVHHLTADESNPKLDAPQPVVLLGNGSAYVRPDARTVDEMLRLIWDASA